MTLTEVKERYVTWSNLMRKLNLSRHCYLHWKANGYIPYYQQLRIEEMTKGELKANIKDKRIRGNADRERAKRASEANQRRAGTLV